MRVVGSALKKAGHLQSGAGSLAKVAGGAEAEGKCFSSRLEHVHDGVVQLREHHEVDRKAGSAVLGGWIAREPG